MNNIAVIATTAIKTAIVIRDLSYLIVALFAAKIRDYKAVNVLLLRVQVIIISGLKTKFQDLFIPTMIDI